MKVLLVEDDALLASGLRELLEGVGHEVRHEEEGRAAIARGLAEPFDLLLLDRMLPDCDGLEVCEEIRRARPGIPTLVLTARGDESDKVTGLSRGADDYLTKPFAARELLARIEALARRARWGASEPERLELPGLTLDLGRLEAQRVGRDASPLTPREAGILRLLHRHRERAVSRRELLEQVWGVPGHLATRTVDMAIVGLRQKIEAEPKRPRIVVSVPGVGYAWGAE